MLVQTITCIEGWWAEAFGTRVLNLVGYVHVYTVTGEYLPFLTIHQRCSPYSLIASVARKVLAGLNYDDKRRYMRRLPRSGLGEFVRSVK
jgi:hypothetical protein